MVLFKKQFCAIGQTDGKGNHEQRNERYCCVHEEQEIEIRYVYVMWAVQYRTARHSVKKKRGRANRLGKSSILFCQLFVCVCVFLSVLFYMTLDMLNVIRLVCISSRRGAREHRSQKERKKPDAITRDIPAAILLKKNKKKQVLVLLKQDIILKF